MLLAKLTWAKITREVGRLVVVRDSDDSNVGGPSTERKLSERISRSITLLECS